MLAEESLGTPPARASVLGKDAKKNLRSYPLQESLLKIRREQREHLKREVGQAKEGNGPGSWDVEFLRQGL